MSDLPEIDLLLGSRIGLWALKIVDPRQINAVFTFDDEIAATAGEFGIKVFRENINTADFQPSGIGFSVHYPRVISGQTISRYHRIYNLHPGLLPWGRGYYPAFWALWERTPAGATLHEITEGIDEGPVVGQIEVPYDECETGGGLHSRIESAEKELFSAFWPVVARGETPVATVQLGGSGSSHRKKEFDSLKQNPPIESMNAIDLLHLAKCLTYPGYSGVEVSIGGKRFALKLEELPDSNVGN